MFVISSRRGYVRAAHAGKSLQFSRTATHAKRFASTTAAYAFALDLGDILPADYTVEPLGNISVGRHLRELLQDAVPGLELTPAGLVDAAYLWLLDTCPLESGQIDKVLELSAVTPCGQCCLEVITPAVAFVEHLTDAPMPQRVQVLGMALRQCCILLHG